MKIMGLMDYFFRLEVWQGNSEFFVSQGRYAFEILHRLHMESCKPMNTPLDTNWRKDNVTSSEEIDATIYSKLVGPLIYLMNTRRDSCYAVNQLSQAMVRPTKLY